MSIQVETSYPAALAIQRNAVTDAPYQGKNQMALFAAKIDGGYTSDLWLTFRQALSQGRVVRKGEKGIGILKVVENKDDNRKGLRGYTVFNWDQTCDLWDGKSIPEDHVTGDCTPPCIMCMATARTPELVA